MPAKMRNAEIDSHPGMPRLVHALGVAGLVILLVGTGFSKGVQNTGMALALLASAGGVWVQREQWWGRLTADWAIRWTVVWILYVIILAIIMAYLHPEIAGRHYDYAWKLSRFFLIGLVAWWVAMAFRRAINGYLLLLAGFVLGAVLFHHAQGWPSGFASPQIDLWEGPQFYTLFSASVLAIALILARDIWGPRQSRWFWFRGGMWTVTAGIAANSLLVSHSRAGLLGLAVGLALAGAALGYRRLHRGPVASGSNRTHWLPAIAVVLVLIPTLWLGWAVSSDRVKRDVAVIKEAIESGEIQQTSMGIRLVQWQKAVDFHRQRPWFGWGPGAGAYLREKAAIPDEFHAAGSHFHSGPLDILLWTGIVGLAIVTLLFASLALGLWRLFQRGGGEGRMALAALTVMAIAFTASTTQTYLTSQVSWFYLAAFLGPAYALVLQGKATGPTSSLSSPETSGSRE
ncbi:O-antigen ligase family protein [Thioalkalivibrio sp.]|uniref:O-antigen ligase family protein n=1 Tax=Thioalkalivibrio sp. TaxID=2093813 RepID=UPI0025DE96FE|nr:O-antigen ligase family protein [Thioalkalivibrio sp.]